MTTRKAHTAALRTKTNFILLVILHLHKQDTGTVLV
jgi:hypothetical protein